MLSQMGQWRRTDLVTLVNCCLILFLFIIIRLPIATRLRYDLVMRVALLTPFWIQIIMNLMAVRLRKPQFIVDGRLSILGGLFFLLWVVAFARGASGDLSYDTLYVAYHLLMFLTIVVFLLFAFWICRPEERIFLRRAVLTSAGLYILVNALLYGIQEVSALELRGYAELYRAEYPAQMLSLVGISTSRVLFPMADGINNFGILAGASMLGVYPLLRPRDRASWLRGGVIIAVCTFVILLADARSAFLFSGLTILLVTARSRLLNQARLLTMAIILALVLSILPVLVSLSASTDLSKHVLWLNRPSAQWVADEKGSADCEQRLAESAGALSNRAVIWETVADELSEFKPIHVFGFGFRGQVASGISSRYACLFSSYVFDDLASAHNLWLQIILDIGYAGALLTLALLLYLSTYLIREFQRAGDLTAMGMLAVVLYTLFVGGLAPSVSPDFHELFILLSLIVISAAFGFEREVREHPGSLPA